MTSAPVATVSAAAGSRGPIGASGLRALASLAGVSPAGRSAPISHLVVCSASTPVWGGASPRRCGFLAPPAESASATACCTGLIGSPLVAMAAAKATGSSM